MRKILYSATAILALALSLVSCNKDDSTPIFKETRWILEQPTEKFGNTLVFDWDYKTPPASLDLWVLVKAALMNPELFSLEGEKMDFEHFIAKIFNGVMFYNDGCATCFYRPKPYTGEWIETSPKNVVTYEGYEEKNTIFMRLNLEIIEGLLVGELGEERAALIMRLLPEYVPAGYVLSRDKFSLYLTKDTIAPIISSILPFLGFQEFTDLVDECIQNTEYLKFGFNFHK
ncbi:MAG: hypothetical protein MJY49_03720 [Bacteroidales bacterium]|nr:hypothetical protein [Bacteroidales bacterium]